MRITAAAEEIAVVADLVARLTAAGSQRIDEKGVARSVVGKDILVVSPYNAQVTRLAERLEGSGVRAGTVDKFQGQEAPIVYSLNRLNVAT